MVVRPTHRSHLPPENIPSITFIRGLVEPMDIVRPEGFCQLQIPVTPLEIEPAAFRLVEQLTKLKFQIAVFVTRDRIVGSMLMSNRLSQW